MYCLKPLTYVPILQKLKNILKKPTLIVDTGCGWFYNGNDWLIQEGLYVGNDDRQHPGQPRKLPACGNTQS